MKETLKRIAQLIAPTLAAQSSGTVRYAFSLVLLLALVVSTASVISSTESSRIYLVGPSNPVPAGDEFQVDIMAYAHKPVNAISLAIAIPKDAIEVLGIDRGESVITLWTKDPYYDNGKVYLEGGTYRKGFIGEHKIATLNVRSKAPGTVAFATAEAELVAGDGQGSAIAANYEEERKVVVVTKDNTQTDGSIASDIEILVVTDINSDGKVTLADIQAFMTNWATRKVVYDFNSDGSTTFRDFSILLADYFRQ
jgi:hypothetical protein